MKSRMNIICIFLCILLSHKLAFAEENKLTEARETVIFSHIEHAKVDIDHKCQKIKGKIRNLEENLYQLEHLVDEIDSQEVNERRIEIMNKIKKYEEKIDNLRLIKISLDTINFKAL